MLEADSLLLTLTALILRPLKDIILQQRIKGQSVLFLEHSQNYHPVIMLLKEDGILNQGQFLPERILPWLLLQWKTVTVFKYLLFMILSFLIQQPLHPLKILTD
jgi:hypothetical protein